MCTVFDVLGSSFQIYSTPFFQISLTRFVLYGIIMSEDPRDRNLSRKENIMVMDNIKSKMRRSKKRYFFVMVRLPFVTNFGRADLLTL